MLDFFADLFNAFADQLMKVLPTSPFADSISKIENLPYLKWINWFIPVGDIITVLTGWLVTIALFYGYSIVLRWIKAIGD